MTDPTVTQLRPATDPGTDGDLSAREAAGLLPMAMVTILAGAALLAGSYLGTVGLLVAVGLVQLVLTISWVLGTALPGRIGGIVLGVLASGAADAAVMHWHNSGYQPVLAVLGVAIPTMFVHQLTRGVVRTRVVESLADIALLVLAVTAMSGLLVLRAQTNGDRATLAVVGAIVAGLVVNHLTDMALPAPRFDPRINRGLPGVVTGIVAGGAVGTLALADIIDFTRGRAAFIGAAAAAVACLISIGASFAGTHTTLTPPAPPPAPLEPEDATAPEESRAASADAAPAGGPTAETAAADIAAAGIDPADILAGDEIAALLAEEPAEVELGPWRGVPRLRPVAAALITVALTSPAGYVLATALGS